MLLPEDERGKVDRLVDQYYEEYIVGIHYILGRTLEDAKEIFHHIYIEYVDEQDMNESKFENCQIVLFDKYVRRRARAIRARRDWKAKQRGVM